MEPYRLSFTSASLSLLESIKVAEVFLNCKDWNLTKEILLENNILQSRTFSRGKRLAHELITRLSLLNEKQLTTLVDGNIDEQKLLLWFTMCKTYPYIREFATDVLHQKFLAMDMVMTDVDYQAFFLRKSDNHPELERTSESTQKKLQSTVFLMMRQADILNGENQIIRILPTTRLAIALAPDASFAFRIFPAFPEEFERLL